ncbi:SufE family protein [Orbaceae bacterium ESL0721]|nr:SufE family protein [Orbaceae bacterium ESL0721]
MTNQQLYSPEKLTEIFAKQHNWQDRYRQLILLSKQLDDLPAEAKIAANQVYGCENRVWLIYKKTPNNQIFFQGDSEGRIVKGLLAILLILANGKTADEIMEIDFENELKALNIIDELSETRLLGLTKLIEAIKKAA